MLSRGKVREAGSTSVEQPGQGVQEGEEGQEYGPTSIYDTVDRESGLAGNKGQYNAFLASQDAIEVMRVTY